MRLFNQRLVGQRFETPVEAIRWLGAVQAQDYQGAKWALGQRLTSTNSAGLDLAFDRGDFLRTHVMRPTWHFVAPEDIRWLLRLTGPRVRTTMATYNRRLGLDDALLARSRKILTAKLKDGTHLARSEIAKALVDDGFRLGDNRLAHILMDAELLGLICSGPLRGKQFTYALLDERVPPAPALARDEALATLALRYFTSHGPATVQDFSWWSGLKMAEVREAIDLAGSMLFHTVEEGKTWWLADGAHSRGVRKEALLAHVVTLNGFVVGGWKRPAPANRAEIETDLMRDMTSNEVKSLMRAVDDYGRFIGLPVTLPTRKARR